MPPDRATGDSTVAGLLRASGLDAADDSSVGADVIDVPFAETARADGRVARHVVAHALQVALSVDLLGRVPAAADYAADQVAAGRRIVLDHGAIRTVAWPTASAVPPGIGQVTRILEPLGWFERETYPLPRLKMTGRSFAHADFPEAIGQWFVSELHPDDFSAEFRRAVERVLGTALDPLDGATRELLAELAVERSLDVAGAVRLLPALTRCFTRLHAPPIDRDYDLLLAESAEMAWIATEGTAFNHATDRVDDVEAVAATQKSHGRPMKERIEVSGSGRVRQTAYRAATVRRTLRTAEGDDVEREVPGSFFEFIDRRPLPDGSGLDLAFDTSNAQGIFAMTTAAGDGAPTARTVAPTARADRVVPRPNTTFKPRRRGLSPQRQADLESWLARWGLAEHGPPLAWDETFEPAGMPVALDIGFGHGETIIEMARARRDLAIVGIEVHTPGVVAVLDAVEHDPLPHVRVVHGDALRFLTRVTAGSLTEVRVFFPDPWPKPRHHDRRLIRDDVVAALVDRLAIGGTLHLATDIEHYARSMRRACDAEPRLAGGVIDRPPWRPMTRFEQRGLAEGRPATDLLYRRQS